MDRKNSSALETMALVLLEEDRPADARKYLLRAVEVDPENGYSKFDFF
jgi:hypothetical protein